VKPVTFLFSASRAGTRKQLRTVRAWIALHRDEFLADWALASSGELPYKIEPL
jgi:hypothetical protein